MKVWFKQMLLGWVGFTITVLSLFAANEIRNDREFFIKIFPELENLPNISRFTELENNN